MSAVPPAGEPALPELLKRAVNRLARQHRRITGASRWRAYGDAKNELRTICHNLHADGQYDTAVSLYRKAVNL